MPRPNQPQHPRQLGQFPEETPKRKNRTFSPFRIILGIITALSQRGKSGHGRVFVGAHSDTSLPDSQATLEMDGLFVSLTGNGTVGVDFDLSVTDSNPSPTSNPAGSPPTPLLDVVRLLATTNHREPVRFRRALQQAGLTIRLLQQMYKQKDHQGLATFAGLLGPGGNHEET